MAFKSDKQRKLVMMKLNKGGSKASSNVPFNSSNSQLKKKNEEKVKNDNFINKNFIGGQVNKDGFNLIIYEFGDSKENINLELNNYKNVFIITAGAYNLETKKDTRTVFKKYDGKKKSLKELTKIRDDFLKLKNKNEVKSYIKNMGLVKENGI